MIKVFSTNRFCQCEPNKIKLFFNNQLILKIRLSASVHWATLCEQFINPCTNNLCALGSTCQSVSSSVQYVCLCPEGYRGIFCNQQIHACESNPCVNGNCTKLSNGGHYCNCPVGYTGAVCKSALFEWCAMLRLLGRPLSLRLSHRLSGSQLRNQNQLVQLESLSKFWHLQLDHGTYCQTQIDYCSSNPCHNGTCVNFLTNPNNMPIQVSPYAIKNDWDRATASLTLILMTTCHVFISIYILFN